VSYGGAIALGFSLQFPLIAYLTAALFLKKISARWRFL
jgi:hypothetical protein